MAGPLGNPFDCLYAFVNMAKRRTAEQKLADEEFDRAYSLALDKARWNPGEEALLDLRQLLLRRPTNEKVNRTYLMTLASMGRLDEALKIANVLTTLIAPENPQNWLYKAQILDELGRPEGVIEATTKALKLDRENTEAVVLRGRAYRKIPDYRKSVEILNTALKRDASNAVVNYEMALTYLDWGKSVEALGCAERILHADPEDRDAWVVKGMVFANLQRFDESLLSFKKAHDFADSDFERDQTEVWMADISRRISVRQISPSEGTSR